MATGIRLDTPALDAGSPLARGLIAWWPMRPAGGRAAYDLGPRRSHHAAPSGAPAWSVGPWGPAIDCDGGHFACPLTPPAAAMTLALWARIDGAGGLAGWDADAAGTAGVDDREFWVDGPGNLSWSVYDGGTIAATTSGVDWRDGRPHAIAGVIRPGSPLELWADGGLRATSASPASGGYNGYATPHLLLGRIDAGKVTEGMVAHLVGRLGGAALWGRALSAAELAVATSAGVGPMAPAARGGAGRTVVLLGAAPGGGGGGLPIPVAMATYRRRRGA